MSQTTSFFVVQARYKGYDNWKDTIYNNCRSLDFALSCATNYSKDKRVEIRIIKRRDTEVKSITT